MNNPDYGRTVMVTRGNGVKWVGRFLQFGTSVEEGVDPPLVWTVALVEDGERNVKEVEICRFQFTDSPPLTEKYALGHSWKCSECKFTVHGLICCPACGKVGTVKDILHKQ